MIKATVIIAFYKNLDYLKLVLAGFERQTFKDFEIVLADDGTPVELFPELTEILNRTELNISHVWHEDKGFRKNKILNAAVKTARTDYLIFIDSDCVPHSKFVEEHLKYAESKTALTGRRVNLSEKITKQLTPELISQGYLEHSTLKLIIDGLFGKSVDVEKGFYFKSDFLRKFVNKKKRGLLGCNFSLHKEDLIAINGFDERYEAPSVGEDSDVQYRLELQNVKIKSLNNIAIQYHLYHKPQPRPKKNIFLFEKIKREKKPYTPYGIKY